MAGKRRTATSQVTRTETTTGGRTTTSQPETTHISAEDRTEEEAALAQAKRQEEARQKMVGKVDASMPKPPNTAGMTIVQAAQANTDYRKRLAEWRQKKVQTAGEQAGAIER
jgi:hypothetical protein